MIQVWRRIIQYEGKTFKTKTGIIFSYKIRDEKIIPQYHVNWNQNRTSEIYGEGFKIKKSHIQDALRRVPVKNTIELNDIVPRPTHLWGILNDKRISKDDW